MFKRRLGESPKVLGTTPYADGSPDIWELESGDFAFIGPDRTGELVPHLPPEAKCNEGERIVVIPRITLISAKGDIPSK